MLQQFKKMRLSWENFKKDDFIASCFNFVNSGDKCDDPYSNAVGSRRILWWPCEGNITYNTGSKKKNNIKKKVLEKVWLFIRAVCLYRKWTTQIFDLPVSHVT